MSTDNETIPLMPRDMPSYKLFATEPPAQLYHYTDYNGANGIIESKTLWLTKLAYLNDTSELQLAITLFQQAANAVSKDIKDADKREFVQEAAHQIESFQNTNICVGSFCEDGDLLSQWRSYSNGGKGVALEFNAQQIKQSSIDGIMNLWRCLYKNEEHQAIIRDLLVLLVRSYDIITEFKSNQNWNQTRKDLIGYFNTTFLRVAPVIKNGYFHEEKEWRLITTPQSCDRENYFARISNNRVSQHFRFDFSTANDNHSYMLNGVVIGPSNEPRLVSDAFGVLLRRNSYKPNHIKFSQIPYRHP